MKRPYRKPFFFEHELRECHELKNYASHFSGLTRSMSMVMPITIQVMAI